MSAQSMQTQIKDIISHCGHFMWMTSQIVVIADFLHNLLAYCGGGGDYVVHIQSHSLNPKINICRKLIVIFTDHVLSLLIKA